MFSYYSFLAGNSLLAQSYMGRGGRGKKKKKKTLAKKAADALTKKKNKTVKASNSRKTAPIFPGFFLASP